MDTHMQGIRTPSGWGRPNTVRMAAAAVIATGLVAAATPAGADDRHDADQRGTAQDSSGSAFALGEDCSTSQERALKGAGDNFALACQPGLDFAPMNDSGATLAPGEIASSPNLTLIANLPKQGAFATDTAYNSDLAFQGDYAYAGNYQGLMVYDVSDPSKPEAVTQLVCPGSQNDVSVWGDLLVLSVDSSRSNSSCDNVPAPASEKSSWEGLRIFDISEPESPEYVAAVETACGSHTHTLAPTQDGKDVYVYVSSYSPNAAFPDCQPPHDRISVVKVPMDDLAAATVVSTPVLFPDGGNDGTGYSRPTSGCHDITAYPAKNIAAGACMGDGILLDISDRANPVVTERVRDQENFAFWHSATFNNRGTKVVFTDELGGGGAATCNPTVGSTKGANGIYDIVEGKLVFRSYYKMPRTQSNTENCVAHNGSLIPVKGRDYMVQAWYQGGISVFDFTDSTNPRELAWFDRGPLSEEKLMLGGSWSAYWYNGHIFSNDIQKGFDVLKLDDPRVKTAYGVRMDVFNPQSQPSYNG